MVPEELSSAGAGGRVLEQSYPGTSAGFGEGYSFFFLLSSVLFKAELEFKISHFKIYKLVAFSINIFTMLYSQHLWV